MGEKRRNGFCLSWSFSVVSGNAVGLFPGERAGLVGRRLGDFVFRWSVAWASSAREVAHAALFLCRGLTCGFFVTFFFQ